MKKLIFVFLLVCVLMLTLSACTVQMAPADKTTVPPCEHEYSEWVEFKAPSCAAQGMQIRVCTLCQEQEWLPMDKLAHTEVIDQAVAPTCTQTGLTEGKHCSACGEVLVEQENIPASHTEVIDKAVAPTCTQTGLTEGKHCSACGEVFVAQETIPAEGHDDQNNDVICDICTAEFVSIGLAYTLSNDGTYYSVSGIGNCKDTDIFIPLMHNGLPVKEIAYEAFYHGDSLTSVVIPDSVTSIGKYAFCGCDSLTSVVIPDSVTSIGRYAFDSCDSLTSVVIPDSVTSIGDQAFLDCHKLVEVINRSSFNIQAGSPNYGKVGYYAKEVHKGESKIVNQNGYLFYTYQGVNYLLGYTGNEKDLILPENYNGEPYEIYQYAFYNCYRLTSVVIGDSITSIGRYAFVGCAGLTSVVIGDSVTSIGAEAFYACNSLANVVIGNSVTSISLGAFYDCNRLTSVVIPDSVTSIGDEAFSWCRGLTSVVIGDSVTSIGEDAFCNCYKLVEVINHSTLDIQAGTSDYGYIGYYAKEVHKGENKIVNQNGYLFYSYQGANYLLGYVGNETDLILPENDNGEPYEIYQYAFYFCDSLTSVVIGDSVTSIGDWAFDLCSRLTSVVIPDSVTSIGDRAFSNCCNLVEVINHSTLDIQAGTSDYGNIGYYAKEVHKGESKIVNQNGYLFYTYQGVNYLLGYTGNETDLILPENYKGEPYEIYQYAFYFCDSLTSVVIPDSVTSIGKYAFYNCTGLENIYYRGTASQWEAIAKGSSWNSNTGSYTMTYNYTGE